MLKKIYFLVNRIFIYFLKVPGLKIFILNLLKKVLHPQVFISSYRAISCAVTFDEIMCLATDIHERCPNNLKLAERYVGLLQKDKQFEKALSLASELCQRRIDKIRKSIGNDYEEAVNRPSMDSVIQVSGYFYSGSGAVLDHLKGYEGVLKWGPRGEVRIVKFPGGLAELYDKLEKNGRLNKSHIIRLFLHITASFYVNVDIEEYNQEAVVNKVSRRMLRSSKSTFYIYELLCLWQSLVQFSTQKEQTSSEFVSIVRNGLQRAFNAAIYKNNASLLLCDQMITAWRIPTARLLPPSRFVIVNRDPRDQFTEINQVHKGTGRPIWNTSHFITIIKKRMQLTDKWIPILESECGHSFLKLQFEDFVINHDKTVAVVRSFFKLNKEDFMKEKTKFDPKISIKNVGKYKHSLNKDEQACLERELPEYIFRQE